MRREGVVAGAKPLFARGRIEHAYYGFNRLGASAMTSRLLGAALAAALLALPAHALTAVTGAIFVSSTTAIATDDFEDLSGTLSVAGPRVGPDGVTTSSPSNNLFTASPGQSSNPTQAIGTENPRGDGLTFMIADVADAFAIDLFHNDGNGDQLGDSSDFDIDFTLAGSSVASTVVAVAPDGGSSFYFLDIPGFDAVTVFSQAGLFEVADNVVFAKGTGGGGAEVPLPAAAPLLLGALGGLALLRRRARG
ncbi:MAG: VPLPA-CTERM sorting domain-containing protein [Pseudomonadota bacterium]